MKQPERTPSVLYLESIDCEGKVVFSAVDVVGVSATIYTMRNGDKVRRTTLETTDRLIRHRSQYRADLYVQITEAAQRDRAALLELVRSAPIADVRRLLGMWGKETP